MGRRAYVRGRRDWDFTTSVAPGPVFPSSGLGARWVMSDASSELDGSSPATPGQALRSVAEVDGGPRLVVTDDARRPTFRTDLGPNGDQAGVKFVSGKALQSAIAVSTAPTRTAYMVLKLTSGDDAVFFSRGTSGNAAEEYAFYTPTPASDALVVGGGQIQGVSGQFPVGAYGVFCFLVDGSTLGAVKIQSYLDGVLKKAVEGVYSMTGPNNLVAINAYTLGAADFGGDVEVLELAIFDEAHTAEQRAEVQAYYAAVYGTPEPAAWSPSDLGAVLTGWFHARSAAEVGGVADGATIETWTDESPTGDDLVQATSGARPLYRAPQHGGRGRVAGGSSRRMASGAVGRVFTHALMAARYRAFDQIRGNNAPTAFGSTNFPGLLSVNGNNAPSYTEESIILTGLPDSSTWSAYYLPTYRRDGAVDAGASVGLERTTHIYEMSQGSPGFSDDWTLALFDDRGRANYFDGDAAEILLLNNPSAEQLTAARDYMTWWQQGAVVCFTGDSLTAGYGAGTQHILSALLDDEWGHTVDVPNIAVPGQGISDSTSGVTDTLLTTDAAKLAPLKAGRSKAVLVVWAGTNDLAEGRSAAQALADLWDYCDDRTAEGWLVVVCTLIDRTDAGKGAGFDAKRATFNAGVVADWADHCAGLADYASDPDLGTNGAANNATYFNPGDKVHLTNASYLKLEVIAQPVIEAVLDA